MKKTMTYQLSGSSRFSMPMLLATSGLAHLTAADHPQFVTYGFFALLFASPFIPHRLLQQRSWLLTINAVTLGYLLFGLGQLVIIKVAPLSLASSFLLVLLTNKLLGPKMARDRQQLILLSLLQMVITTALSTNLTVGVLLMLYALILPMALTSVNFQQSRERLASSTQRQVTPIDTRGHRKLRLLMLSTGVGILTSTMLFFLFVPRLG
ncbi:MAG: hypothetical protein ACPGQS_12225, partial [Bradymonadia bacterium]